MTVLFLMNFDINDNACTAEEALAAHRKDVTWLANPYKNDPVKALGHAAVQAGGPIPQTLTQAMLLDVRLGIMPTIGEEMCVGQAPR